MADAVHFFDSLNHLNSYIFDLLDVLFALELFKVLLDWLFQVISDEEAAAIHSVMNNILDAFW